MKITIRNLLSEIVAFRSSVFRRRRPPTSQTHSQRFWTPILSFFSLPPEVLIKIATHLDTTRNLANFKMTCKGIHNVIESVQKVVRTSLPHLKIQEIQFKFLCLKKLSSFSNSDFELSAKSRRPILDSLEMAEAGKDGAILEFGGGRKRKSRSFERALQPNLKAANVL